MKRIVVILMAASLAPVAAVAQDWQVYRYPDAGFAVQFPEPPVVDKGTFSTPDGTSVPMTRYAARQRGIVYSVRVIDFSSTNPDARNTIAETEKSLGASGKVTVAIDARINREYGRELSINGADGTRSTIAIFFFNEHLYLLDGQSLPPNAIARSGDTIRFQQSLQFIGANAGFSGGFGGFGGFGRFGGPGGGRFRGAFNPQALSACQGKSIGDTVQLDTPAGPVSATCTLIARPNRAANPAGGTQN